MQLKIRYLIIKDGKVYLENGKIPERTGIGEGDILKIAENSFNKKINVFYSFYQEVEKENVIIYVSAVPMENFDDFEEIEIDKLMEKDEKLKRYLHYLYIFEKFFNNDV